MQATIQSTAILSERMPFYLEDRQAITVSQNVRQTSAQASSSQRNSTNP